jgi:hypothetical protein
MLANLLIGQTPEGKLIIESDPISCAQYFESATKALMTGKIGKTVVKEVAIVRVQGSLVDMPKHMQCPPGGVEAVEKAKADEKAKAAKK